MVADLDEEARIDLFLVEVRVAGTGAPSSAPRATKANRASNRFLTREYPMEAIERSLIGARIVLERSHEARGESRLRRPVRPVQEDELVGPPLLSKIGKDAI